MKTNRSLTLTIGTLILVALTAARTSAQEVTATFTNGGGDGTWTRDEQFNPDFPGNWDTGAYPDVGHKIQVPNTGTYLPNQDPTYDVLINLPTACTIAPGHSLSVLTLSVANVSTLDIAGASLLAISNGSIVNNGSIVINSNDPTNSTGTIRFDNGGTATISGSGDIRLNGATYNAAVLHANATAVTIASTQTIHGRGDLFSAGGSWINDGTINSDVHGDAYGIALSLVDSAAGHKNNATIEATNGGSLTFVNGVIDQTGGGTFLADGPGSEVHLGIAGPSYVFYLVGGTVTTSNGGVVLGQYGNIDSVTNNGDFRIPGNYIVTVTGSGLTNNATVLVNSTDPDNSTGNLRFDASGALAGPGVLTLNGNTYNRANLIVNDTFTLTQAANHTIQGKGDIGGNGGTTFVNNGVVNANATPRGLSIDRGLAVINNHLLEATNGSTLTIDNDVFGVDQTGGGTIVATGSGSVVQLGGGFTTMITGGVLNGASGGVISSVASILAGSVTNANAFEIRPNGFALSYATTLTNNGTMTLDDGSSFIRFDENSTNIIGSGSIVLTNGAAMTVNGGQTVVNGPSHTIKGNGSLNIGGTLTNDGTIAPGLSPGQLNFNGDLELGSTSNLSFEIGGTGQGTTYDRLNKTDNGTLTLNGDLTVRLINGFAPANSDIFTIVTTQQALAGAFSNVVNGARLNTADGGGSFQVIYTVPNDPVASSAVTLSDFQPGASPTPSPAAGTKTTTPANTPTSPAGTVSPALPTATNTPAPTGTPTAAGTATAQPSPTPTATPAMCPCTGDCGCEGSVSINDLIVLVNIALGDAPASMCTRGVPDGTTVDIALIVRAVNNALSGCG